MTQIILKDLKQIVVEKLQLRATRKGRNLTEELKAILEDAASFESIAPTTETLSQTRERLEKVRQKYEGRTFINSTELLREGRQQRRRD